MDLDLDDYKILDDQVYAIGRIKQHSLIDKRNSALGCEAHFAGGELELQAGRIGRLEQARTYETMNLNCGGDDVVSDRIEGSFNQHGASQEQTQGRSKSSEMHHVLAAPRRTVVGFVDGIPRNTPLRTSVAPLLRVNPFTPSPPFPLNST